MGFNEKDDEGTGITKSAVGYGKPPVEYQFQKGVSGNPKGRPRNGSAASSAVHAADQVITREAYRSIDIRDGEGQKSMPVLQVAMRGLGVAAAKGNRKAQVALVGMVLRSEERIKEGKLKILRWAAEYKRNWAMEFKRLDMLGEPRPDPLPHPDELEIDIERGVVFLNCPFTEVQSFEWDAWLEVKKVVLWYIEELNKIVPKRKSQREDIAIAIEACQIKAKAIDELFPDRRTRRSPGFDQASEIRNGNGYRLFVKNKSKYIAAFARLDFKPDRLATVHTDSRPLAGERLVSPERTSQASIRWEDVKRVLNNNKVSVRALRRTKG